MIFSYIGTPFFIGLIWFSLIRPGSRSAHDYLFGTYIVETNIPEFETCQLTLKKSFMPILLSVFLFGGYLFHLSNNSISVNYTESMGKAYAQIQTLPNVQIAGISEESNKYTISIQETKLPFDNHKLSVQAACSLINNLRLSDPNQQIQTIIVNGYDMKIYRSWNYYAKNLSLREWKMEESKLIQKPIDRK